MGELRDARLGDWLDLLGDLLRAPLRAPPLDDIAEGMRRSFQPVAVVWSESLDPLRGQIWQQPHRSPPLERWRADGTFGRDPLIRWYARTADPIAQADHLVPAAIAPRRDLEMWTEEMRPWGVEHEIAIPLSMEWPRHKAFVIARHDEAFPASDVALARRIQPVLAGLLFQVQTLARTPEPSLGNTDLTPRETAVLQLLSDGLTAAAAGRRLQVSPRTIEKHIEHIYVKLRVDSRVSAVRTAMRAGLLDAGLEPARLPSTNTETPDAGRAGSLLDSRRASYRVDALDGHSVRIPR